MRMVCASKQTHSYRRTRALVEYNIQPDCGACSLLWLWGGLMLSLPPRATRLKRMIYVYSIFRGEWQNAC